MQIKHVTITGAAGFLGTAIINRLRQTYPDVEILGIVLSEDDRQRLREMGVASEICDVSNNEQVTATIGPTDAIIHCAAIVTIDDFVSPKVRAVNVGGTRNILDASRRHHARLVYISSVHALTEKPRGEIMAEADHFDPAEVVGGYAKTKAEAAQLVLDATDVERVILHPSGIIGPGDPGSTNLTNLVDRLISGELGVVISGGYDMVDVRDVAAAAVTALTTGDGCYVLSGHYATIREIGDLVTTQVGRRKPLVLPQWLAKVGAIPAEWIANLFGRLPLFTRYSLYTLNSGNRFSYAKAQRELGFSPRPVPESIHDMVEYLQARQDKAKN